MIGIETYREDAGAIRESEEFRGNDPSRVDKVVELDSEWREKLQELEELRAERNEVGDRIAEAKQQGDDAQALIDEMKEKKQRIEVLEEEVEELKSERDDLRKRIGNIVHESVPEGENEDDNVPIRRWEPEQGRKEDAELAADVLEDSGLIHQEKAVEVSGERAYYMEGPLFRLNQALISFAMDLVSEKGFTPLQTPFMLNHKPMEAAAELEDFEEQLYSVAEDRHLIATSEQTLAALKYDEIIEPGELPIKYAGFSTNFRREAGKHGQETRGIWRIHQFEKVEQFIFCEPENSWDMHQELIENAEEVFQKLELPYRVVNVCTGDLGDVAAKKFDVEVWRPPLGEYGEVVSCSNCTEYQATELGTRIRRSGDNELPHTLNATACATQRTITALIENHMTDEGLYIPEALRPYLGGKEYLELR